MKLFRRMFALVAALAMALSVQTVFASAPVQAATLSDWQCDAATEGPDGVTLAANAYLRGGLLPNYLCVTLRFDQLAPASDLNDWSSYVYFCLSDEEGFPDPNFMNEQNDKLPSLNLTLRSYNGSLLAGINGYDLPDGTRAYSYSPERTLAVSASGEVRIEVSWRAARSAWEFYINGLPVHTQTIGLPLENVARDGKMYLSFLTSGNVTMTVSDVTDAAEHAWYEDDLVYPVQPYPETTYDEPYRNQFHFSSQGGWMYDINGLLYLDGEYHMFYQHHMDDPELAGRSHIGHAVSRDLVHWTQLPVATQPGAFPGLNNWSGTAVVDSENTSGFQSGDTPPIVMFYTGTDYGICIAYSNDRGRTFESYAGNPVIPCLSTDNLRPRDPKVFYHEESGRWVMVLFENGSTFYVSDDLRNWEQVYSNDFGFECPDLYRLPLDGDENNQKWVLADASGSYLVGEFDGTAFYPEGEAVHKLDYGTDYYAGQTFTVAGFPDERIIQIAWMHNWNQPELPTVGWTNGATFPTELRLVTTEEGVRLVRNPIDEIELLYEDTQQMRVGLWAADEDPLAGIEGDAFDITLTVDLARSEATSFGFAFSNNFEVRFDAAAGTVSYTADTVPADAVSVPGAGESSLVTLRVLRDAGSVELFVNGGRFCSTNEVPFDLSDLSASLVKNGDLWIEKLTVHTVGRAWDTSSHAYPGPQTHFDTNLSGNWQVLSGSWNPSARGIQGESDGADAFYRYDGAETADLTNFAFEADISVNQGLGGLIFRADEPFSTFYCANIQRCYPDGNLMNRLRLWRRNADGSVTDLAVCDMPADGGKVVTGKAYHYKVVCRGDEIEVWLGSELVLSATDSVCQGNFLGLNVFGSNEFNPASPGGYACFDNVTFSQAGASELGDRWRAESGAWSQRTDGMEVRLSGAFPRSVLLSETRVSDFVFETSILHDQNAAGLLFRADADGRGLAVLADRRAQQIRLYDGDALVRSFPIYLDSTLATRLKVVASGSAIRVYANGQFCFSYEDGGGAGYVGLVAEGYTGSALFNGTTLRAPGTEAALGQLWLYDEALEFDPAADEIVVDLPADFPLHYLPLVTARATDRHATVSVIQADMESRTALVAVTSENGLVTKTYRVVFRLAGGTGGDA